MVRCQKDGEQLAATDWVEIPDGVIHVTAKQGATSSSKGHRIDGFEVIDLEVTRGADGLWEIASGTDPQVIAVAIEAPTFELPPDLNGKDIP